MKSQIAANNVAEEQPTKTRSAVGYVRVSTDMQAQEGLSLDAQTAAIEQYCTMHRMKLLGIYRDVISGAKEQRPGLQEALYSLQRGADVLIVLKFDRLSRSIRHFCELYERYFKSGERELVAIRESIRLDSSLGRALVGILLVFAQMEREATGERIREAVHHIQERGYFFGKVPFGKRAVPAPDNPRFRILIDEPDEQAVLMRLKTWRAEGIGITEMANRLNAEGIAPPQGPRWTKSLIYNLKRRLGWHDAKPFNDRPHTDAELKERMLALRDHGHTYRQIAALLNEEKWVPLKGSKFTDSNVYQLFRNCDETTHLSPKRYLERLLAEMDQEHQRKNSGEPFRRPGLPKLATLLTEAGYLTPRGHTHWWPAQVQQLLLGHFQKHYAKS